MQNECRWFVLFRSHNSSSPSPGRGFFVPGFTSGDSVQMMSLSDVMDAAKGLTNMYLAHEIAVDKDFMVQDLKPKEEDPIQSQVKEIVHKAFWDLLDQQLKEDPPCFDQALVLLTEVKEGILALLVPQQKRLIDNIKGKLDIELIRQQAENGVLNFQVSQTLHQLMCRFYPFVGMNYRITLAT